MGRDNRTIAVIGTRGFPGVQGGVEKHCQCLYPLIKTWNFRVYRRKPYLTEQSQIECDGIEFVDLSSTRVKGFETVWHSLCSAVHCLFHRPALVHVHNMGPAMFALLVKLVGVPVVMTYHSVNYEHSKWGKLARWLLRLSEWLSLKFCDRIIFVNRVRMEQLGESVRKKSVYIPNGIAKLRETRCTDFLAKNGIVPREYVLAVGRITQEKGFDLLMQAACDSSLISQVVIAGESDHNDRYVKRLSLLPHDKVVFTGYAGPDELNQLYSHARMLALPSLSEGMPMVLLEAMAHHLPVVVSDLPATRFLRLSEQCYFKSGDATALREAVESMLCSADVCVNYELKDYDWNVIAERTCSVFQQVLA